MATEHGGDFAPGCGGLKMSAVVNYSLTDSFALSRAFLYTERSLVTSSKCSSACRITYNDCVFLLMLTASHNAMHM